jgi:hypothetical protein
VHLLEEALDGASQLSLDGVALHVRSALAG